VSKIPEVKLDYTNTKVTMQFSKVRKVLFEFDTLFYQHFAALKIEVQSTRGYNSEHCHLQWRRARSNFFSGGRRLGVRCRLDPFKSKILSQMTSRQAIS